jgi:hypothetical protein
MRTCVAYCNSVWPFPDGRYNHPTAFRRVCSAYQRVGQNLDSTVSSAGHVAAGRQFSESELPGFGAAAVSETISASVEMLSEWMSNS